MKLSEEDRKEILELLEVDMSSCADGVACEMMQHYEHMTVQAEWYEARRLIYQKIKEIVEEYFAMTDIKEN
jgi:hypothetical protein